MVQNVKLDKSVYSYGEP